MANTPPYQKGASRTFPFAAVTAAFLRLVIDSSGNAAIASAQQKSVGVNFDGVASAGYGDVALHHQMGTTVMVANAAITADTRVYAAASGKVAPTGMVCEGIALSAASADGDLIEVMPIGTSGILQTATVAASASLNSSAVETTFGQTLVLAANTLQVGDVIHIYSQGIVTSITSTPTLIIKIKIGSSIVCFTPTVSVAANDIWVLDARIVVRTAGASGTLVCSSMVALGTPSEATTVVEKAGPCFLASTTVDTTATQTIDVTGTWSASSASNACRQDIMIVRRELGALAA